MDDEVEPLKRLNRLDSIIVGLIVASLVAILTLFAVLSMVWKTSGLDDGRLLSDAATHWA